MVKVLRAWRAGVLALVCGLAPLAHAQNVPTVGQGKQIWRDYTIDGNASSGVYNPQKRLIRNWATAVEAGYAALTAGQAGGSYAFPSLTDLTAFLGADPNAQAFVYADASTDNNGIYRKIGASGAGSWSKVSPLVYGPTPALTLGTVTMLACNELPNVIMTGTAFSPAINISLPVCNYTGAPTIPTPTATSLGGVKSATAPANNFQTGVSTAGIPTFARPSAANISGLGTAATVNIGTSGATIPLLSAYNTWDYTQTFLSNVPVVATSSGASGPQVRLINSAPDATGAMLLLRKQRDAGASLSGDAIGTIGGDTYNGAAWTRAASIIMRQGAGASDASIALNTSGADIATIDATGLRLSAGYLNWSATAGSGGYGLRNNAGTIEVKHSAGGWTSLTQSAPSRVLLATLTASTSAELTDTTSLGLGYARYEIVFENLVRSNANTNCRMQIYSGGSYQTTGYLSYAYALTPWGMAATAMTDGIPCDNSQSNASATVPLTGSLHVANPSQTSGLKLFRGDFVNASTLTLSTQSVGYWSGGNGALSGLKIAFTAGTITSGAVKIYGLN